MADWIKLRTMIAADPRVVAMADFLATRREFIRWLTDPLHHSCKESAHEHVTRNVTVCVTVASLVRVWGVGNDRGKIDGEDLVMHHATLSTLDELAGLPCFGEAMRRVGWAVVDGKRGAQVVRFPRFMKYNVPVDDARRQQNAERQKRFRERKNSNAPRNVTRNAKRNARGEKRREDKRREEDTPALSGPIRHPVSLSNPVSLTAPVEASETAPGFTSSPDAGPGRKGGPIPVERFIQLFLLRHAEAFGFSGDSIERQRKALTAIAVRMFDRPDAADQLADSIALAWEKRKAGMRYPVKAWQAEMNRRYPKRG